MQEKTRRLHVVAEYTGLKINVEKTNSMRINGKKKDVIWLNDKEIEEVDTFLFLDATMDKTGGTEADIGRRLGLARTTFVSLAKNNRKKMTKSLIRSIENALGARILKIHWPEKITNQQLYERTRSIPLPSTIKRKRWRWIGHILRREENSHVRTALTWAPEEKRQRRRPKNTWRRSVEREREEMGLDSWKEGQVVASDRRKWRSLLNGLMRPPEQGEDKEFNK
ncbi:uncharacterized protein LOC134232297 [Saccostrea cucullata]|uniref:uncharacterized protein LOC134232297 n=1 Tax=Saccostrea cuccullata TaxID=36930 RepID=UPI002ED487DE